MAEPADIPEECQCNVCMGVLCQPAHVSANCTHAFCRMCVFRLLQSKGRQASCPLCRAPATISTDVLLPSEIGVDASLADDIRSGCAAAYDAAAAAELVFEDRLQKNLIPKLSLLSLGAVNATTAFGLTGQLRLRTDPGKPLVLHLTNKNWKRAVWRAGSSGSRVVGVVFNDGEDITPETRGFIAHLPSSVTEAPHAPEKVRLRFGRAFKVVAVDGEAHDHPVGAVRLES